MTVNESLISIENMASAFLASRPSPTAEDVRQIIASLRQLPTIDEISDEEAEQLARRLEERISITQQLGSVLVERDHVPWLHAAKSRIEPYYWDRYRRHLVQEGIPNASVVTLDHVTDRTLELMSDPGREGPWDRRGMVVGHVQSGKTANYTGLICKAADAGYKVIIVIAGIHNNLRTQTQRRIDEGFVGRDSARLLSGQSDRLVGVGLFDCERRPVTFTNTLRDFNKSIATSVGIPLQNLIEPAIFVIKKNTHSLRNLTEWLREHSVRVGSDSIDEPMLLIDDEADNASINIRYGAGEVSRINGQIRQLLGVFDRSCYIGYTATPFANIFIDPDSDDEMRGEDLFPRSFIISLDPPSNYFGPPSVFLEDPDSHIRHIEDNEDCLPLRHRITLEIDGIPESLQDAIRLFVLARATRLARGQAGTHNSMLVNASRFTNVQRQLRNAIHDRLSNIQDSARLYGNLPPYDALDDPEIKELYNVWKEEYASTEFEWVDVQARLHDAASPIRVIEINSTSSGSLDYNASKQNGLNVIAVGGFSLSRGLTLEGLVVSYFLRNSVMYDTLMQMGRWFGYRQGYEDLCRIWMPESARGWYEHIADSTEELRSELRLMEAAGASPEEFGLKVRSHPDNLMVTARNKMGTGAPFILRIGLACKLIETHALRRDTESLESNRRAVRRFAASVNASGIALENAELGDFGWLVRGVPARQVLRFLSEFINHEASIVTSGEPVGRYIQAREEGELAHWDVLFASVKDTNRLVDDSLGIPVRCARRALGSKSDANTLLVGNRQRVSGRGIERVGLTPQQQEQAEREYEVEQNRQRGEVEAGKIQFPDWIYRRKRTAPLLMIHLIEITTEDDFERVEPPVVAWGISFPPTLTAEERVEYVVNTTWLRENYGEDLDEEELSGDDD